jgi:hypothetical protein
VRGDDLVDAETHAVDRIRALLDEQRIDDALSGFADAERLFGPNSQLAPQRHGIEAIARCKREPDESIAATFVAAHPSSSLVGRVRKACKATGEGP